MFGVKIKCSDVTYKVSGLTAVNTFDAFDGVEVEFNGISPDGSATVNTLPTAEAAAYCARAGWSAGAAILLGRPKRVKKTYDFEDL